MTNKERATKFLNDMFPEATIRLLTEEFDAVLEQAAQRLEHRATSEQICIDKAPMVRDGSTAKRLYAIDVLREEASWIRGCKSLVAPPHE